MTNLKQISPQQFASLERSLEILRNIEKECLEAAKVIDAKFMVKS